MLNREHNTSANDDNAAPSQTPTYTIPTSSREQGLSIPVFENATAVWKIAAISPFIKQ